MRAPRRFPQGPPQGSATEIGEALAAGQIVPWFQPQVSTDSGALAGAEALARWAHPARGLLLPSEFLPAAEAAGLSERLGATMLHGALSALRNFDAAGLHVPSVSVNFAPMDLRNPAIVDRVRWELDRFGLAPDRLTVEVLETVIEEVGDDMVTRNLAGLAGARLRDRPRRLRHRPRRHRQHPPLLGPAREDRPLLRPPDRHRSPNSRRSSRR